MHDPEVKPAPDVRGVLAEQGPVLRNRRLEAASVGGNLGELIPQNWVFRAKVERNAVGLLSFLEPPCFLQGLSKGPPPLYLGGGVLGLRPQLLDTALYLL